MRNKNQKFRFTDPELALIKVTFADNDELLYIIRKVMLQFDLSEDEQKTLRGAMTEQVYGLVLKFFLPYMDPDAPLFQLTDMRIALGADIKGLSPDGAWPFIKAKDIEQKYMAQQLHILNGSPEKPVIMLNELCDTEGVKPRREEIYTRVMAWNFLLSYIDSNIQQIKFLAGLANETVEETKTRLEKNSTK